MSYSSFKNKLSIISLILLLISIPSMISHVSYWTEKGDGSQFMTEYVKQSNSKRAYEMCSDQLFGYQGKESFNAYQYMLFGNKSTEHNTSNLILHDTIIRLFDAEMFAAETDLPDEIGVPKGVFDTIISLFDGYQFKATNSFFGVVRLKVGESTIVSPSRNGDMNKFFSISGDTEILEMTSDNCFVAKSEGTTFIKTLYFDEVGDPHQKSIKVKIKSLDRSWF